MKPIKFICPIISLLILLQFTAIAQSDFAPIGATWYHNFYRGVYKTTVINDTIILGEKCNRLGIDVYFDTSDWYAREVQGSRSLFIYSTEDTVFIYNEIYKKFTPLYVFNVVAGDTVRLPVISPGNSCTFIDTPKVKFAFIVDSVKNILYDGVSLKTVFSTPIKTSESYLAWTSYSTGSINIYAQKLGSLAGGLLPNCKVCKTLAIDGCYFPNTIRCYSDDKINIKIEGVDSCLKAGLNTLKVSEFGQHSSSLKLYPNPAISSISIGKEPLAFGTKIAVFDAFGKMIFNQTYEANIVPNINLQNWSPGVYYIRLLDDQNQLLGAASFSKK